MADLAVNNAINASGSHRRIKLIGLERQVCGERSEPRITVSSGSRLVGRFAVLRFLAHRLLVDARDSLQIVSPQGARLLFVLQAALDALPLLLALYLDAQALLLGELAWTRFCAHPAARRSIHA
jgi:hypothetical protein